LRRISIKQATEGMILAKTVYGLRGEALLRSGEKLTEGRIKRLAGQGHAALLIRDELSHDIEPRNIISERIQQQAMSTIAQVFEPPGRLTRRRRNPRRHSGDSAASRPSRWAIRCTAVVNVSTAYVDEG